MSRFKVSYEVEGEYLPDSSGGTIVSDGDGVELYLAPGAIVVDITPPPPKLALVPTGYYRRKGSGPASAAFQFKGEETDAYLWRDPSAWERMAVVPWAALTKAFPDADWEELTALMNQET